MSASNIDIWVSAGVLGTPYYRFYTDPLGTEEITELTLDQSNSYTFFRLYEATLHPFYISDTGYNLASTDAILITGDGSPSAGITGNQSFKIEFTEETWSLYISKAFREFWTYINESTLNRLFEASVGWIQGKEKVGH